MLEIINRWNSWRNKFLSGKCAWKLIGSFLTAIFGSIIIIIFITIKINKNIINAFSIKLAVLMFLTGFKKADKKNNKSATEAITYDSKLVSKEKSE